MAAPRESAEIAKRLIRETTCRKQGIEKGHADASRR